MFNDVIRLRGKGATGLFFLNFFMWASIGGTGTRDFDPHKYEQYRNSNMYKEIYEEIYEHYKVGVARAAVQLSSSDYTSVAKHNIRVFLDKALSDGDPFCGLLRLKVLIDDGELETKASEAVSIFHTCMAILRGLSRLLGDSKHENWQRLEDRYGNKVAFLESSPDVMAEAIEKIGNRFGKMQGKASYVNPSLLTLVTLPDGWGQHLTFKSGHDIAPEDYLPIVKERGFKGPIEQACTDYLHELRVKWEQSLTKIGKKKHAVGFSPVAAAIRERPAPDGAAALRRAAEFDEERKRRQSEELGTAVLQAVRKKFEGAGGKDKKDKGE